jgi:hypothetical protein
MKKILISIFLLILTVLTLRAQDKIPYPLRNFTEDYISGLDLFNKQEEFDLNFNFDRYFFNIDDTLFWPDNFNLTDRFFKHRFGPQEAYSVFKVFREKSSDRFNYLRVELGDLKLIKSKTGRYYDKYKVRVIENHVFSSADFFSGRDSIRPFENNYEIVSWFNPSSENMTYEYRINKIYEKESLSFLFPSNIQLNFDYLLTSLKNKIQDLKSLPGFGGELKASWLLGGKGYTNYSLRSGVGITNLGFKLENAAFQFKDNSLVDKDTYPFTLNADLKNFSQRLSLGLLNVPIQLQLTTYSKKGRFTTGLYGGINLHFPLSSTVENTSGEVVYSGMYKFDFYPDSIPLGNLNYYNFRKYTNDEFKSPELNLQSIFVSAEVGGEFNWYLGRNWVANVHLSYMSSLSPFFQNSNQTISYNIVDIDDKKTFEPALNSFLTKNEDNFLNAWKFGIGINYILEKPVIPFGKVGSRESELKREIKNKMVLTSGSYSQSSKQKTLYISVKDTLASRGLFAQRIPYRFIGPTPKFFSQGKISSSSRSDNKLSFVVPASNSNASLFLEEPYGYNITVDNSYNAKPGGMYGEIKEIQCQYLWRGNDDRAKLEIQFRELSPLYIFLVYYKYDYDDAGAHNEAIKSTIKENILSLSKTPSNVIIYFVSDQPVAMEIKSTEFSDEFLERIDTKLKNTNEVFSDLEGLKGYLSEKLINPRRNIMLQAFTSEEFLDETRASIKEFPKTLSIDNEFVKYSTYIHPYNRDKSPDFEKSINYLRKAGDVINN